jgi:hypothetical protein
MKFFERRQVIHGSNHKYKKDTRMHIKLAHNVNPPYSSNIHYQSFWPDTTPNLQAYMPTRPLLAPA